ncbi:sugar phosphate isomerase/epimerase [Luteolibacter ambystomatis]|uniref:Sugar phosphate isomerase/epimerase n=1 Tax=Luteolibacter ambystomatis TaxID=2824561 RepID=A0A975J007_9BACT|nr:sugar phosphate isomerase/epimerase [Luteolibacter ambystomatis]QUE51135.1 sugar phosphate isomerase/epimerase [Luteolibacter ambystomatis]
MMKRRSLLTMVPAVSVLFAMRSNGKPIPQPALTAAGFSIAVQCWSFNKYTLWEAIEKAASTGASSVELYPGQKLGGPHGDLKMGPDLKPEIYQSLLDHLSKNGLVAVNYGVCDVPKDETKARATFEMAKTLGLYGLTTESLEALDTIEKLAKEYDVKVCFHNHPKGTKLGDPLKTWEQIKDRHENVGFCCDVGHLASSGWEPLEIVKKISTRIRSFHLKDRESIEKWTHDRPFGTGVINLPAILDEVRSKGFAGNVSIEYEHNWETSVPEISQCVGYLRAYSKLKA